MGTVLSLLGVSVLLLGSIVGSLVGRVGPLRSLGQALTLPGCSAIAEALGEDLHGPSNPHLEVTKVGDKYHLTFSWSSPTNSPVNYELRTYRYAFANGQELINRSGIWANETSNTSYTESNLSPQELHLSSTANTITGYVRAVYKNKSTGQDVCRTDPAINDSQAIADFAPSPTIPQGGSGGQCNPGSEWLDNCGSGAQIGTNYVQCDGQKNERMQYVCQPGRWWGPIGCITDASCMPQRPPTIPPQPTTPPPTTTRIPPTLVPTLPAECYQSLQSCRAECDYLGIGTCRRSPSISTCYLCAYTPTVSPPLPTPTRVLPTITPSPIPTTTQAPYRGEITISVVLSSSMQQYTRCGDAIELFIGGATLQTVRLPISGGLYTFSNLAAGTYSVAASMINLNTSRLIGFSDVADLTLDSSVGSITQELTIHPHSTTAQLCAQPTSRPTPTTIPSPALSTVTIRVNLDLQQYAYCGGDELEVELLDWTSFGRSTRRYRGPSPITGILQGTFNYQFNNLPPGRYNVSPYVYKNTSGGRSLIGWNISGREDPVFDLNPGTHFLKEITATHDIPSVNLVCPQPTPSSLPTTTTIPPFLSPILQPSPTLVSPTQVPTRAPTLVASASCSQYGGPYSPQPAHLGRELCADGRIIQPYEPNYSPPNLVNLRQELGNGYLMEYDVTIHNVLVNDLKRWIDDMTTRYQTNPASSCVPLVVHGYRSYQHQQQLYDGANCVYDEASQTDVVRGTKNWCGVTRPGFSAHQSGTAIDLFCAAINCQKDTQGRDVCTVRRDWSKYVYDVIGGESILRNYNFTRPMSFDRPHYQYLQ